MVQENVKSLVKFHKVQAREYAKSLEIILNWIVKDAKVLCKLENNFIVAKGPKNFDRVKTFFSPYIYSVVVVKKDKLRTIDKTLNLLCLEA